jgi:hypothetical protein
MLRKPLFFFFILFLSVSAKAQKNDTVVLINNNIITGEIKKLELGLLTFKTDGMGTVHVKAEEIKSLRSNKRFQIQLSNGYIYFGSFDTISSPGTYVKIITATKTVYKTNFKDIVEIYPFRKKFWSRMSGSFSLGVNYSKSSKIFTTSFSGNLKYRGKKRQINLNWTDNISMFADSVITDKQANTASYKHYIKKRFSGKGAFEYAKNKELDLQRRLSLNILAGMDIIHRYRSLVYFGSGLSANSELYTADTTSTINMEWVFEFNAELFKRSHPQLTFATFSSLYPSLSVNKRVRISTTIEGNIEVFKNFYVGVQFYDDFDNKPHGDDTNTNDKTNDWGINGTITYSFH